MPKVKNPLFSQEARGGIAGLVFNTWRGINYVKTNTSPTGQGTEKRLAAQAIMSAVSKQWQALDDAQRAAWSQYAIDHPVTDWTGSPKRLTGMNWYMSCNIWLTKLGQAELEDPPTAPAPDAPTAWTLDIDSGNVRIAWSAPTGGDETIMIFAVGPISPGVTPKIEQCQVLTGVDSDEVTPYIIYTAAAVGRYGVFGKCVTKSNGLQSTWVSDIIDVT